LIAWAELDDTRKLPENQNQMKAGSCGQMTFACLGTAPGQRLLHRAMKTAAAKSILEWTTGAIGV
jgi:hypothetical protein